jgi:hypothetical protein
MVVCAAWAGITHLVGRARCQPIGLAASDRALFVAALGRSRPELGAALLECGRIREASGLNQPHATHESSSRRSATMMSPAASMRARCENAWGKLPR